MTARHAFAVLALATSAFAAHAQCPDGSPPPCARATPAFVPPSTSVAVLYFENLSSDSADAYLADGLTEEIITRLGRLNRLVVKSRAAVRRYRGRAEDPQAIGRALVVSHLLSGTVRRSSTRLRVNVELIRASNGDRVWGESYDRTDTDLLQIEEDISRAVALAVGGRLLPSERVRLASRPTRSAAAFDLFLRGNYLLTQRNPNSMLRALELYEAALARDPAFHRARARIALAYGLFHDWEWEYPGLSSDSVLARALAASEQALREDPNDADAWLSHGYLLMYKNPRTLEGALQALERGLMLDPNNAEGLDRFGWLLALTGRDSAAETSYRRALAAEPGRAATFYQLARMSQLAGRLQDAARWLDTAIVVDPGSYFVYGQRAQVRLLLGDTEGARQDAELLLRLSPPGYRPYRIRGAMLLARAELQSGDFTGAAARIDRLLQDEPVDRPTVLEGWYLGMALVALGRHEAAIDFLERVRPRGAKLWFGLRMPEFDAIRAHPRFQNLVASARPAVGSR